MRRPFPGADLIPGGKRGATMAVTIEARPARVWPWLVQMGYDRAGYYSWDILDNFGRPSADRIHPEWQKLSVGDHMTAMGRSAWEVAALEPERFLGLRASFDLGGAPVRSGGTTAAFLHRFALRVPPGELSGRPHPARGQRLLDPPAAVASAHRELLPVGTSALDHADAPVRESQAFRGACCGAGSRQPDRMTAAVSGRGSTQIRPT